MKKLILSLFCIITIIVVNAQTVTVLANDKGVSLSYKYEYVDSRRCMERDYDQYLVTGYLENKSAYNIRLMVVNISSDKQDEQVKAPPCGYGVIANVQFPFYSVLVKDGKLTLGYYILIRRGEQLWKPAWQLNYNVERD